ncbi:MAG TPA: 23S rRNA (adenine(2503)-C(2))-methyltransferase RlmN [Phycisphaerae bacterium]|nr:23S rRNA (adenine(2503)-C(2))-methyltransferase RlmN [Phycisphaerae bacterium]HNU43724.1 23S rRNA (adenine(2503)-C(2))-methyltransferase RlmN [Phycisphaerae bacterium]
MIEVHPDRRVPVAAKALFDHTLDSLGSLLADWNEPTYRARQVMEWVYRHGAEAYTDMTNVPRRLREKLSVAAPIFEGQILRKSDSDDGTVKLLLGWADGGNSECVMIPDEERRTACVSTQVGCPVGCSFCASGLDGLQRQLSAGQMVEQVMRIRRLCEPEDRLSNVVFMGTGEPLANYDATLAAVRTINAPWGMQIGARKITISTVGLPAQMRKLADEQLQVTLALSLHAPNDELRRQIIPWASRVTIEELVEAARYYFDRTGREITIEYVLLGDVNDRPQHAEELAAVCHRMRSNVNLIVYNPVPGLDFQRPAPRVAERFLDSLRAHGVNTHLRRSRGLDVDAACGQLRRQVPQVQRARTAVATKPMTSP